MSATSARADTALAIDTPRCLHFSSIAVTVFTRFVLALASSVPSILSRPASLSSSASTSELMAGVHVTWADFCSRALALALAFAFEDGVLFFDVAFAFFPPSPSPPSSGPNPTATLPRRFDRTTIWLSASSTARACSANADELAVLELEMQSDPTTDANDGRGICTDRRTTERPRQARYSSTISLPSLGMATP